MEPQPLGLAQASPDRDGLLDHSRDLWQRAPAWRLLVGSTAALFVASVATGVLSLRQEAPTHASVTAAHPEQAPLVADIPQPQVVAPRPSPPVPQPAPAPPLPALADRPPAQQQVTPKIVSPAPPEPRPAPATGETACAFRGGNGGGGQGRIVGFLSRERAAQLMTLTQQRANARINPDYVSNIRAIIMQPDGRRVVVLVPPGMAVKPGDRVAFASGHRDWSMACGYIPNLIIGLLQSQ